MEILIITILIVAAIILFLVELFFIPGISIAGILALASLGYATYYAFDTLGPLEGFITLIISIIACGISMYLFMRSKTLDKVALKKNITSKVDRDAEQSIKVGDTGIATTRLALIGQAEINDKIVEVRSIDGFLDEKTPIIVERVSDGTVLVRKW
ncbi:NfeD family protein [Bacteroides sp. 519]|uniref:NfeD family protein n=1 Tax=Bacteroides sp. 519 TaxID=2302937 RepID=UPI0013D8215F|nr:NfeD family protein [Bacteroides sp. 519]NDV58708.1 nodulation efficiency protein D (NfeD) [Bacteroides sp. 519]